MPTRETHARIYQGEIDNNEYRELERSAKQRGIPLREIIVEAINKYLKKSNPKYPLDIEEMDLKDGSKRFYLWIPYENYNDLVHLMKTRGIIYIQELVRRAARQRNQIHG